MSVDKMSVDKMSVDKMSVDKMSVEKMSVEKMSVDKMSVDKMSVDKMSVDKMSVDKMSVDKMSVDKMSVDKMSVDKMSADETTFCPIFHVHPSINYVSQAADWSTLRDVYIGDVLFKIWRNIYRLAWKRPHKIERFSFMSHRTRIIQSLSPGKPY
jgi:hypothetical protein